MLTYTAAPDKNCGAFHIGKEYIYVAPLKSKTNRRILGSWKPRGLQAGEAPADAVEDELGWAQVAKGHKILEKYNVSVWGFWLASLRQHE